LVYQSKESNTPRQYAVEAKQIFPLMMLILLSKIDLTAYNTHSYFFP